MYFEERKQQLVNLFLYTFFVPILLITFFKLLYPDVSPEMATRILTGNIIVAIMLGAIGTLSNHVYILQIAGTIEYYMSLPIKKIHFVLSFLLSRTIFEVPNLFFILFLGKLLLEVDFQISFSLLIGLVFAYVLIGISVGFIGILIGTKGRSIEEVAGISTIASYIIILVSPIFIPLSLFPQTIQFFWKFLPTTWGALFLENLLNVGVINIMKLLILIGFGCLSLFLMERVIKWRE